MCWLEILSNIKLLNKYLKFLLQENQAQAKGISV